MKQIKFIAFSMAAASILAMASCNNDDDDVNPSPSDAIVGSYVDSLSYSVGTMSNGTIQNDTLVISKVAGKDNMVDLHFLKYMGMGGKSSELYIYNVVVTESNGSYALGISSDEGAVTKAKMTSSSYDVTKVDGQVNNDNIALKFDFLIAAMNATFSNEYNNGKKIK